MVLVIGNEGCSRCKIVKDMFTNKGIEFEYKLLSDLSTDVRQFYLKMARAKGLMQMPIIIKDGEAVDFKEVNK